MAIGDFVVQVPLTADDKRALEYMARRLNLTEGDVLRNAGREKLVKMGRYWPLPEGIGTKPDESASVFKGGQ